MIIETSRLHLIPLTAHQLTLWTEDISRLEKELNCTYSAEPIEGIFLEIVKGQATKAKDDEANYLFHSFWFIIRKSDRVVVGSAGFKNIPNENDEVEIGYGLGKDFEGNGYMTEAVYAMCSWAKAQDYISYVIAETEAGNPKSENVLKRCGFTLYMQDTNSWWKV